VQGENALDAFVVYDSANGEHFAYAAASAGDNDAGENLDSLLAAFDYSAVYVHCITDFEMRDFVFQALAFNRI
jgi:hypothetical protein